jgi:DNA modification methylase
MKIQKVDINSIIENPDNPRTISKIEFEKLVKSIKDFPLMLSIRPIVINNEKVVLGGNMRLKACKEAGLKEVHVIKADDLTPEQQKEFIIKDNVGFGAWDWDKLGNDFDAAQLSEWGLDALGIEQDKPEAKEDDFTVDPDGEKNIFIKLGDLIELGRHRVLCGNSTSAEDLTRLMNGAIAEMMFTDPPYGVDYQGGHFHSGDVNIKRKREKLASDDTTDIYHNFLKVALAFVDGACYMWFAGSKSFDIYKALKDNNCEISALIIWHKTNATYGAMNAQYKQRHEPCIYFKPKGSTLRWCGASTEATVWSLDRDGINEFHPTQKPIKLAAKAIGNHTAASVLDCFLGSGTTLIASDQLKRTCYGMEISPKYCQVIIKRYKKYCEDNNQEFVCKINGTELKEV